MSQSEKVILVRPIDLEDNPKRAQFHSSSKESARFKVILNSIATHGIKSPILVQKGTNLILGGHLRREAALELNMAEVPVIELDVFGREADVVMVTDNLDRTEDETDPMRIARQCKAMRDQRDEAPKQNTPLEVAVWEQMGMSKRNFRRYITLLKLLTELQKLVSELKIGIKAGNKLAQLNKVSQQKVFESIRYKATSDPRYRMSEQDAMSFLEAFGQGDKEPNQTESEGTNPSDGGEDVVLEFGIENNEKALGVWAEDTGLRENESNPAVEQLIHVQALEELRGSGYAKVLEIASADDEDDATATDDEIVASQQRAQRVMEAAHDQMESLLTIEDDEARDAFALKQASTEMRTLKLALERSEIDLLSRIALTSENDRSKILDELREVHRISKRLTWKLEQVIYGIKQSIESQLQC